MTIPTKKYFTISEISRITGVKSHTLRYWESEFKLLRPARRESGQRKYTQKELQTITDLKELLYEKKYTISGAKRKILDDKRTVRSQMSLELEKNSAAIGLISDVKKDLKEMVKILSKQ